LVIHPASTIYCDYESGDRVMMGVTEEMVRVSVGIEHKGDIIEDFAQALGEA
jgi:O-acetylhomoserine (thiol)-lyase